MDPKISKELKNATEKLQTKMLAMQQAEADMLTLKTAFVNATDPAKKEKLKPALIAMAKKLKAAEADADQADAMFHKALSSEPDDVYDLLDHKIQEHIVRLTIRKIVKESFKKIKPSKINEAKTPKTWDTMFAMRAIKAFKNNEFNIDDTKSIVKWDTKFNGGITPRPPFETESIIRYFLATKKWPDGKSANVNESVNTQEPVSLHDNISKWFTSNKTKLEKLADEDSWDEFYDLGFEKFPDADQDDVAQAMNTCAMQMDWFAVEETEMPTEKELEAKSFGDKSQQKGIQMTDYDKKMKSPKTSSTELYIESKKKMK